MDNTNEMKKILLVDDDEMQLEIAKGYLDSDYRNVITAKSGREALQLIYKGLIPDLILLDILMPDIDGWETYNRLKAITVLTSTPIAFMTSVTEEEAVKRAYELGVSDFIIKPYSRYDLSSRVNKMLEENNDTIRG
jgi:putative two-component system response regulator